MRVTPKRLRDIERLVNKRVIARLRDDRPIITGLVVKSENDSYYLLHDSEDFKFGDRPEDLRGHVYGWWLCYGDFCKGDFKELITLDEDEKLGAIL